MTRPNRKAFVVLLTSIATGAALVSASGASGAAGSTGRSADPLYGVARREAQQHAHATLRPGVVTHNDSGQEGEGDPLEVADQAAQFAYERSAPAASVSARALLAARAATAKLTVAPTTATEITTGALNAEPSGYTDPYWSNAGAGFREVSGRATAVATSGRTIYAGTADGGVWKSSDDGASWASIWDTQATLSIGALTVAPDKALWVGTGEANTSSDSYQGVGVFRSTDGGKTFRHVGGSALDGSQIFYLRPDHAGHIYAATSHGLYRHSVAAAKGKWTLVLKPDPNPSGSPYDTSFITDVAIRPGTNGQVVLAALGWRGGTAYNGFYLSTTGGGPGSFTEITPTGDIDAGDIGRTTFAYAADGSRLYAIIQSPKKLNAGDDTNLQGVYVSPTGDPTGPWRLIADSDKLDNSGSALKGMDGYHVGIQSWYNQALAVDPQHPRHFWVSLEEVFQSRNGGRTFTTASPYWNYGLDCGGTCPPTTHPDQHALALTGNRKVVIGNDGGFYSRPMSDVGYGDWTDLNHGIDTLQYYDAAAGKLHKQMSYWGGLQDNGTSVLNPSAKNIEPAGGDGGFVLVDPANSMRAVGEYTNLAMYRTEDGGHTFTTISPLCGYYNGSDCDPSARFTAPFQADIHDPNHWVAAGNEVWDSSKGFTTVCDDANGCDWTPVHSFGTDANGGYNVGTAVAVSGTTTYAAWVDSNGNPSPSFQSGIDTNYGGAWHRIASPALPNRYIAGLTVDPANPAHVYAVFNGYSRRWIPGGGIGTVFESSDGGSTWHNITANLPDAPGDALAVVNGKLILGTDVGLFLANESGAKNWQRVAAVPNSVVDNVRPIPGRDAVVVATHGRGIWRVAVH